MQFRQSGQGNDRRRRLFCEEAALPAGEGGLCAGHGGAVPGQRTSANYPDAAFLNDSARVIDLIPRRLTSFGLILLLGLGVVAGLEALYAWMPQWTSMTTDGRVAALDLDGEGSLAVWFSSTLLGLAALVAVIVYSVRRHKTDDYQGHYRVWLWAAMCWILMGVDETASLHEGFKEMMAVVTGTRLLGDGSLWWVIPYGLVLGAVGSRLLVDMRHCRLSSATLMAAAGCYVSAVVTQVVAEGGARAVMVEEGAEMAGDLMLLMAMGLHARYVIRDAEGFLPQREPKADAADDEEDGLTEEAALGTGQQPVPPAAAPAASRMRVDAAQPTPQPASRGLWGRMLAPAAKASSTPPSPHPPLPETADVRRKLTKAERKALRKRLLEQRLARQRGQQGNWS